jgi:uncharacterized protein YcbX
MPGRVVRISIAPVKGLALVHPQAVELTQRGVVGDRRFWMVTADGRLANGKTHPRLMQVHPDWDEPAGRLALRFPGGDVTEGLVELGDQVVGDLWGEPHPSRRVLGPWQAALSEFIGEPLTLLRSESGAVDRGADRSGWVSIISRASLERLREVVGGSRAIDGRRFRMLFEIDGVGAHEEDTWIGGQVAVGDAVVSPLGDVGRCAITNCDPDTGASDLDTLGALAAYRRHGRVESLPFGVWGDVLVPGRVGVADVVSPRVAVA